MLTDLSIKTTARQELLSIWAREVESCRNSGLSVPEWCARNHIKPKTYYYHQKQVFDAAVEQRSAFVKAEIKEDPPEQQIVARVTVNDMIIDVMNAADIELAVALITALKDA